MCLVKETLGVASLATAESVTSLLDKMRDAFRASAGEQYDQRLAEELTKVQDVHRQAVAEKDGQIENLSRRIDELQDAVRDAGGAALVGHREMSEIKRQNTLLLQGLEDERKRKLTAISRINSDHDRSVVVVKRRARIELMLLLALLLSVGSHYAGLPFIGPVITFVCVMSGLWWVPDRITRPIVDFIGRRERLRLKTRDSDALAALTVSQAEAPSDG